MLSIDAQGQHSSGVRGVFFSDQVIHPERIRNFRLADFTFGGHFGLLGMYERAELSGADLSIQSQPVEGTRIVVILPGDQET
jgi:hypothetical protein